MFRSVLIFLLSLASLIPSLSSACFSTFCLTYCDVHGAAGLLAECTPLLISWYATHASDLTYCSCTIRVPYLKPLFDQVSLSRHLLYPIVIPKYRKIATAPPSLLSPPTYTHLFCSCVAAPCCHLLTTSFDLRLQCRPFASAGIYRVPVCGR